MDDLRGRVAVVTGGASGIGLALARRFATEGMHLVLADIEQTALDAAAAELGAAGTQVLAVRTDVADAAAVEALAAASYERFGAVHVVVNNAGVVTGGAAWEQSLEDWTWVLGVDLWGVIHGVRSFVPRMVAGGEPGHVVNTASIAGLLAMPGIAPYDVAKAGVVSLSECLHHDLQAAGAPIGVSVLCPGRVRSRIGDSDRNRPGGRMTTEHRPGASETDTMLSAEATADLVVSSIRDERFWILTHDGYDEWITRRAAGMLAGRPSERPPVL